MTAHDCGHSCCDERHDPNHDHFLPPEKCPPCTTQRADLAATSPPETQPYDGSGQ